MFGPESAGKKFLVKCLVERVDYGILVVVGME